MTHRFLRVAKDGIRTSLVVGLGALVRLVQPVAGDESFQACDDVEVIVLLRILAGHDLAAELVDVREWLQLTVDERVGLREQLVLEAHASDAAGLQLRDELRRSGSEQSAG